MNESSLYLAQVMGLYLVLTGLIIMMRQKLFMAVVKEYVEHKALRTVVPIIQLLAGLALVVAHNVWTWDYRLIITMAGYLMIVESVLYLLIPEKTLKKTVMAFNTDVVYKAGGAVCILLGLYLVIIGFHVQF
jgi:hypothetical protein